jgi:hypothetical protein
MEATLDNKLMNFSKSPLLFISAFFALTSSACLLGTANASHVSASILEAGFNSGSGQYSETVTDVDGNAAGEYNSATDANALASIGGGGLIFAETNGTDGTLAAFNNSYVTLLLSATASIDASTELFFKEFRELDANGTIQDVLAEVSISFDGSSYEPLGNVFGLGGSNILSLDSLLALTDPLRTTGFNYIKVQQINNATPEDLGCQAIPIGNVCTALRLDAVLVNQSAVPLPPAAWLFGSGLIGLLAASKRRRK